MEKLVLLLVGVLIFMSIMSASRYIMSVCFPNSDNKQPKQTKENKGEQMCGCGEYTERWCSDFCREH